MIYSVTYAPVQYGRHEPPHRCPNTCLQGTRKQMARHLCARKRPVDAGLRFKDKSPRFWDNKRWKALENVEMHGYLFSKEAPIAVMRRWELDARPTMGKETTSSVWRDHGVGFPGTTNARINEALSNGQTLHMVQRLVKRQEDVQVCEPQKVKRQCIGRKGKESRPRVSLCR